MGKKFKLYIISILLLIFIAREINDDDSIDISSHYQYPKDDDNYIYIPILGTNDLHGKIFPIRFNKPNTINNPEYYYSGGAEYIFSYLEILREDWGKKRVIWLDAGDQFQGGYEFTDTNGTIMHDFYNTCQVDAMAIGNHEFDFGIDYLKKFIKESSFPYLAANIYNKDTNKYIYEEGEWKQVKKSLVLHPYEGIKIGIIGLATISTPITTGGNVSSLEFHDPLKIIEEEAKRLRNEENVNAIILLTHLGSICNKGKEITKLNLNMYNKSTNQEECDEGQELNTLLNKLNKDLIDAIVSGHTHDLEHHWINGIPVIQSTGFQYSNIIYLPFKKNENFVLDKDKIQIEGPLPSCELVFENSKRCEFVLLNDSSQGKLKKIKFHGKDLKLNQDLKEKLDNEREKVNTLMDNKIVENHVFLNTSNDKETHLTNMVVDIGRKVSGADFAFFNLGGYRTSWYPGTISELDLHLMFPFDNEFVTFEMSGEEIIRTLKTINRRIIYPSSGLIQVYRKSDENNILVDAKVFDGVYEMNIEPFKTYVVCVNDFLYNGGSQFKHVMKWYKIKNENTIGIVRNYVSEYLKNMGNIYEDSFMDTDHPRYRYIE